MSDTISLEPPTPDLPLLRKILDHIDVHPEEWDQGLWAEDYTRYEDPEEAAGEKQGAQELLGRTLCDTTFCIAGHAVAMTEGIEWDGTTPSPASGDSFRDAGQRALGLTGDEASSLFSAMNSRELVQYYAEQIAARAGEVL